jgi:hypothetical protein
LCVGDHAAGLDQIFATDVARRAARSGMTGSGRSAGGTLPPSSD